MPRINLLPWREELRKERQKNFLIAAGVAVLAGIAVIGAVNLVYSARIDHQQARNNLLTNEIKILDESIREIDGIERQKERLLARMEVIEELQRSRPEVVHLFDELTRTVPDGVTLDTVIQTDRAIRISGVAQSSTRVSSYMRNVNGSEWIGSPDLTKIETIDRGQSRERFSFTLTAVQRNPNVEEDEGVGQ
ncbi:MAG: PilN domain-containing protein [Pseudomonadota bacterium]